MAVPLRPALPVLALALSIGGCGHPGANLAAGERLSSSPLPLPWEGGLYPRDAYQVPPYAAYGAAVTRSLQGPWSPLVFSIRPRHCYALELRFGSGGVGPDGPLSDEARRAKPVVVIATANGERLARADGTHLDFCNAKDLDRVVVDLESSSPLPSSLGTGALRAQLHERELTSEEAWQIDARATPLFAGGGIALEDGIDARTKRGGPIVRSLASFEPVPLGALAPSECIAVTAKLAAGAVPTSGLTTFDAPLVYTETEPAPGASRPRTDEIVAHKLVAGRLVAQEQCNHAGAPVAVWLVATRPAGTTSLGTGEVVLEVSTRPMIPRAAQRPFLDGGLHPMPGETLAPRGQPVTRRLEAFAPLPLSLAPGECLSLDIALGAGATVRAGATGHSHLLVYEETAARAELAVVSANGAPAIRTVCNLKTEPWTLALALRASGGKPPGTGPMTIQVMTRAARPGEP